MWQICYTNWLLLPFSLGSRTLAWNYETSLPSTGFVYTYVYLLYSTCVFSGAGPVFPGYLCLWNCVLSTHLICSLHWSEFVCPNLPACFCPLVGSYWDWPLHVFGEGEGPLVPLIKSFPDCLALFGLVFGRLLKFDSSRGGEDDLWFTFFRDVHFLRLRVRTPVFYFLLISVPSELWPIIVKFVFYINGCHFY